VIRATATVDKAERVVGSSWQFTQPAGEERGQRRQQLPRTAARRPATRSQLAHLTVTRPAAPTGKGLGWYTGAEDGYMYVDQLKVEDIRHQVRRPRCARQHLSAHQGTPRRSQLTG
jgi:hypothetical protein